MNNFNGFYYFAGKGFCGLFVFDDMGNAIPVLSDTLVQAAAFATNGWHVLM